MANVKFLSGSLSDLQKYLLSKGKTDAIEGAFYLTNDTHRLYVGTSSKSLALLNKTVQFVATQSDLPNNSPTVADENEKNVFYYVVDGNMLVVWNGTEYVQVNAQTKDTDTDTIVTGAAMTVSVSADENTIVVNSTINREHKNVKTGDVTSSDTVPGGSFTLTKADILSVIDISVGVHVPTSTTAITPVGNGANTASAVKLTGSGAAKVTRKDEHTINVDVAEVSYTLNQDKTKITLKDKDATDKGNVTFVAGNGLDVNSGSGTITYSHESVTTTPKTSAVSPAAETTFTAIDSITTSNGHVTGYNTKTIALPKDNNTTYNLLDFSANNEGKISITLHGTDGVSDVETTGADLYYTVGKNGDKKVLNQGNLDVYTTGEIDQLMRDINAMVYKGTVGKGGTRTTLPSVSDNVNIGDTYMTAVAGTYGGHSCGVGDLLIATGKEDQSTGYITGSITWTYVPSANDTDTKYNFTANNNNLILSNSVDSGTDKVGVSGDALISLAASGNKLTVAHLGSNATKTTGNALKPSHGGSFDVVTGLKDTKGHVTSYTVQTVTLPTDNNTTYDLALTKGNTLSVPTADADSISIDLNGTGGDNSNVKLGVDKTDAGLELKINDASDEAVIKHKKYEYSDPSCTSAGKLTAQGSLTVVTGANVENGHITGLKTTAYTLPDDKNTTYDLKPGISGSDTAHIKTVAGGVRVAEYLEGSDGPSGTIQHEVTSSSLTVARASDTKFTIDMTWGTF